jgi:acyl CoA:acetate/3-ketoacid CoA transferase beta subunit
MHIAAGRSNLIDMIIIQIHLFFLRERRGGSFRLCELAPDVTLEHVRTMIEAAYEEN